MEVVIRNHLGLVLASMVDKVPPLSLIEAVESLVAVHAFQLASDCGFPSIILEGDLEIVNNALRSEEESFTSFGHLIAEAKTIVETFYAVLYPIPVDKATLFIILLDMLVMLAVSQCRWRVFFHT